MIQMGDWRGSDGAPNAVMDMITGLSPGSDTANETKTPGVQRGIAGDITTPPLGLRGLMESHGELCQLRCLLTGAR